MSIELHNLSVVRGGNPVLTGISADFPLGQLTCILGPNGAGKTSLLRTVTGEDLPVSGTVSIDGVIGAGGMKNKVAFAPQMTALPEDLEVEEMLSLARFDPAAHWFDRLGERDRELIDQSATACGIRHLVTRKISSLSGGETQRAWLAFCLAQDKPYLLLDESLSAIDFVSRRDYFMLLRSVVELDRGVVLVTHDLAMVNEFADSVLLLAGGEIRFHGAPGKSLDEVISTMRPRLADTRRG